MYIRYTSMTLETLLRSLAIACYNKNVILANRHNM